MIRRREKIWGFVQPFVAVAVGLALSLAAVKLLGDSPTKVLGILFKSAFGTREDLGMTLFYATPLVFTGLSVAIAFHAGLFNIGAEGQLLMGAMAATAVSSWVGARWPGIPSWLAPAVGVLGCLLGGALWGWIPGYLRAKRGSHEVINTIMLNFVASGVTSYVALYLLKNPDNQNPETAPIASAFRLRLFSWFGDVPLNTAFVLALFSALLVYFILWRTRLGYEIRAVGENEEAARSVGIQSGRVRIVAMTLAGAVAGMVGANEILGSAGKFRIGFSPEYGFIGIAVALLGRNRPLGVVAAALLFGALHKGTADLDLETDKVTRDFSQVLQALIILAVIAAAAWDWVRARIHRSGRAAGKKEAKA